MSPRMDGVVSKIADGSVAPRPRVGAPWAHPWRYAIIVATALVGLFASCGMFLTIRHWQDEEARLRFASLADDHLRTINAGLKDATDLLWSMRAYVEALNEPLTRAEFQRFSRALRGRVPGLRDTGWAPRITAAEREVFETEVRADGFPDFEIKERGPDGKLVRAGARDEYFPILFSDPGPENQPVMGFDIASEPVRGAAIARARIADAPAATPPVKLMNIKRPNGGMMSFIPVRAPSPAGDKGPITGIVLGAFETEAMIENTLATKLRLTGLNMYVFDPRGAMGDRLIYWHATDGSAPPPEASLWETRHFAGTLELLDQRWGVILAPAAGTTTDEADHSALIVLISGLIVTGSLVAWLLFTLRRTRQLERLAAELRDTSNELRRNGIKLDHLARHDALTGLANRMAFRDEVASGLRRARRGQDLAVLYLDLDRFKAVNDTLGHPAGDRLLCQVADRLREAVRETDVISRLGGDEFAIAQSGAEQPRSAETLSRRLIEMLSRPYDIDGHWVAVGVSVGIAVASNDDPDVDAMLRRADMALYVAKREGRGVFRRFQPAMEAEARARRGLELDLRDALANDEFEILYQPQVTLADGRVRVLEALLRWRHPKRGLVLPGDFIACAEETGLIAPIGEWVLRNALAHAAGWPEDVRLAVNISPHQLPREDLIETIEAVLAETGQNPARLELEVTEHAVIDQRGVGQTTLRRLRAMGPRLTMDDFGTGYASLSNLCALPFDRVKIDRTFIASMTESKRGAAIVHAIVRLAQTLGIETVAEGVETAAQLAELRAMGCAAAQGFLFSSALPAGSVSRLLASWEPGRQADRATV